MDGLFISTSAPLILPVLPPPGRLYLRELLVNGWSGVIQGRGLQDDGEYRVLDWNLLKVIAYCSKNMSKRDLLSKLGAPQMWSI